MNLAALNVGTAARTVADDVTTQITRLYASLADSLPGSDNERICELRAVAMERFSTSGLPHRRIEEWKYTDLRRAMIEAYAPSSGEVGVDRDSIERALGYAASIDALRLVFVNGAFRRDLSGSVETVSGVTLHTLGQALHSPPDWLLSALGSVNAQDTDVVGQLNAAFMTDGVALHLTKGASLSRPVHIIHVAAGEMPLSASLRNVIVAEEGSEATLIESFVSLGAVPSQTNSVTEVTAAPDAKIRHYKILVENDRTQHLSSAMIELGARADYLAVCFTDGAGLSRQQTFMKFSGDHARGRFYGVQLLDGRQHCDMTLVIDHASVGCESREHVKSVLADHAQGVFQAKVVVRPGAQKTDGHQMAQALLLSENAEFDSKPELEIYADDVKCNHGSTTGALDRDLLFYLQARGIPEDEAMSLLIQAFAGEVIDKVEHDGLREAMIQQTARWLA